jgi:hypothetical protein
MVAEYIEKQAQQELESEDKNFSVADELYSNFIRHSKLPAKAGSS